MRSRKFSDLQVFVHSLFDDNEKGIYDGLSCMLIVNQILIIGVAQEPDHGPQSSKEPTSCRHPYLFQSITSTVSRSIGTTHRSSIKRGNKVLGFVNL